MTYKQPKDVTAPRTYMRLDRVLLDPGEERATAYALQFWYPHGERSEYGIGARWNGDPKKPNGTPNISGHACWFVLDRALWPSVLAMVEDRELRDYAVDKLYGGRNGSDPGTAALTQESAEQATPEP